MVLNATLPLLNGILIREKVLGFLSCHIKRKLYSASQNCLSSQGLIVIKLPIMETSSESHDVEHHQATDPSKYNATYAEVLSKGRSTSSDESNNNPSLFHDVVNGNENSYTESNPATTECAANDSFKQNMDSYSVDLLYSNSLNNTEDVKFAYSAAEKCSNTSYKENTAEKSVPVTTVNGNCGPNDQDISESPSSVEYCGSEEESDEEESNEIDSMYPSALKWKFRSSDIEKNLPETVTILETAYGSKVFLVGTAHFSMESQEDVAKTIKAVQPDVVMIELCKSRVNILSLDEVTILEESKNMNFQKIKAAIEQNGFLQGVLYLLLLSMSAHLTKQLGMAPGGEFRRAFVEAKQIPGCLIHLGDRPIHITLQRALATLSWWQKLRIAWYMLHAKDPISKEEVERCKQKDLLEEMLAEMTGEFPELSRVFVKERDIFLTYSLQMSAAPIMSPHSDNVPAPSCVVGVVGIGHVPGIKENWGKVSEKDIPDIVSVPEPSMSSKVIYKTIRFSLLGLGLYGIYKIFPKSLIPTKAFHFTTLPLNFLHSGKTV